MKRKDLQIALSKSITYVENSLRTSVSYEGHALHLLVDELQFLFYPACVIIETPSTQIANISKTEIKLLADHLGNIAVIPEAKTIGQLYIEKTDYGNFPLSPPLTTYPVRLPIIKSKCRLTLRRKINAGDFTITIYLNAPLIDEINLFEEEKFHDYVNEAILLVASLKDAHQENGQMKRLLSNFKVSPYLELVFEHLQDRIIKHLSTYDKRFSAFVNNPFFLQYFLAHNFNPAGVNGPELRFYPLKTQRRIIEDENTVKKVNDNLAQQGLSLKENQEPVDFLTEYYVWRDDASFAGYSFMCGCSMYESNWALDPLVQALHLGEEERKDRLIATTIMNTLRDDTQHQFIIPLFANRQPIGVVLLNCPEDIPEEHRITPIRSARSVGLPIRLALETDDAVNHIQEEKRKAAQVRAYKHSAQSIMHDERAYCIEIQSFLANLQNKIDLDADPTLSKHWDNISYIIEDKLQLIKEFESVNDHIMKIDNSILYPSLTSFENNHNISIESVRNMVERVERVFNPGKKHIAKIALNFGNTFRKIGHIPDFSPRIISRILANFLKNSDNQARHLQMEKRQVTFTIDIFKKQKNKRFYLTIICEDNCGGFTDPDMPEQITFDSWVHYLNTRSSVARGMGFMTLAKYAEATDGQFTRANINDPEKGAKMTINLGLNRDLQFSF